MRLRRRAATALFIGAFVAVSAFAGTNVAAAAPAPPDSYAAYSMIDQRSAGRFVSPDGGLSQWSWRTDQPGQYSVAWDAKEPDSRERFIRSADGNWLFLDGWSDNNTYYTQRVAEESLGDGGCNNMRPIPLDGGRQHYVKWFVPGEAYCLNSKGTITEESSKKAFRFEHRQIWSPPHPCSNAHFTGRTCVTQHEIWWDDNQHPWQMTLDRKQAMAKDLGMAFTIRKTRPDSWSADLRDVWKY